MRPKLYAAIAVLIGGLPPATALEQAPAEKSPPVKVEAAASQSPSGSGEQAFAYKHRDRFRNLIGMTRLQVLKTLEIPCYAATYSKNYMRSDTLMLPDAILRVEMLLKNDRVAMVKTSDVYAYVDPHPERFRGPWIDENGVVNPQPVVPDPPERNYLPKGHGQRRTLLYEQHATRCVGDHWHYTGPPIDIFIVITVDRAGKLLTNDLVRSCGQPDLDKSALAAVQASTFDPLPEWYKEDSFTFMIAMQRARDLKENNWF